MSVDIRPDHLAKNTVLNFAGLVIPAVIGVVTAPIVIGKLGTDRFGLLSLVLVVFGYFTIFDLGLGRATTKYMAEALARSETERLPGILWTAVGFQAVLGLAGAALQALLTPWLVGHVLNIPPAGVAEAERLLYLLALSLPINIILASFRGALEAGQRFDVVNAIKVPTNSMIFVVPLLGVMLGLDLTGITWLLVGTRFLSLLVWIAACFLAYPGLRRWTFLPRTEWRPLFTFGGWSTLSSAVWPVLSTLDRFMVGSVLNLDAVSFYSVPNEAVLRLGVVPGSLQMTLFPAFSSLQGRKEEGQSRRLFLRSMKFMLGAIGPVLILIIVWARPILRLWLGEEFVLQSAFVLQVLAAGYLLVALGYVPYCYLQGIGRPDLTAKFQLAELVVFLPVLWVLTKAWGINGTAIGWAARGAVDAVLHYRAAAKLGHIAPRQLFGNGVARLGLLLAGLLAATAALSALPGPFSFAAGTAAAGVFYALSFRLVLDPPERDWVKRRWQAVLGRGKAAPAESSR
jgi:O-antigen/teichoic acid export membrane protein